MKGIFIALLATTASALKLHAHSKVRNDFYQLAELGQSQQEQIDAMW